MGSQIAKLKRLSRMPTASLKNVDKVLEVKSAAQRHPSTVEGYKELLKSNPSFQNIVKNKDEKLHKMLETVRVDSVGAAPKDILKTGKQARKINVVPEGKLTPHQLDELFTNCKVAPKTWTQDEIATKYKIDNIVAKNLLSYFSSFHIYKKSESREISKDANIFLKSD